MKFNIYHLIKKHTTWKKVGFFMVLNIIIQRVLTLNIAQEFKTYSNDLDALDMKVGYGVEYVQELLLTTSSEGLSYYLHNFFALDLFFPLMYSISYTLLLSFLFVRAFSPENKLQKLIIVPFIGAFFDYLENFCIVFMISILPDFSPNLALLTSVFSFLKWIIAYIGMTLTLIGVVMWIIQVIIKTINKNRKISL